jgi:hypothetical protein
LRFVLSHISKSGKNILASPTGKGVLLLSVHKTLPIFVLAAIAVAILFILVVPPLRRWLAKRFKTFDYLWDYVTAFHGNFLDIVWGVAVVGVVWAIPFSLWGIVAQFSTIPAWLNWAAVGAAFLITSYYVWRVHHVRLVPKIEFGDTRVVLTPIGSDENDPTRAVAQILVRLCSPDVPIVNCVGKLLAVLRWSNVKNNWEPTAVDEPLNLLWSTIDKPTCTLDVDRRLCIFFIDDGPNSRIWPSVDIVQFRMSKMFKTSAPNDIFRFDISVKGDNCPEITASLKVQMGSNWSEPSVQQV